MNIGKPLRIIEIPKPSEKPKRVQPRPERKENEPIHVPDWPVRKPVKVPQDA